MQPSVRLFGVDKVEINGVDSWFMHAPPEKGMDQWKDGYSAKEQAKAWTRRGAPEVPEEWWAAVSEIVGPADELYGRPEHQTRLDRFPRARQHDLFACLRFKGTMTAAVGVEAKACEGFDGLVGDRASAEAPSNKRPRCNLLAQALFGRAVFDEATPEVLDRMLASHGYQLWTAAVGTIIEAQARGLDHAILVVHQFRPRDLAAAAQAGDPRKWESALRENASAFVTFTRDVAAAGGGSYETKFVKPDTRLLVVKVESPIDM